MRKHLYVDGKDLADFGIYISGSGTFNAPEKEVTTYRVPGRNGLVLGADERIENIEVTYPCFIYTNFAQNMRDLRSYLLSRSGYVRIADDYDTTHFRMGFFEAGIDTEPNQMLTAAQFELTFNCQPQRWLTSGETMLSNPATVTNPTLFASKPLIRIYGAGTLKVGDVSIVISAHSYTWADVDCETMQVYNGDNNLNAYANFTTIENGSTVYGVDAPTLKPGNTAITATSISTWYVTPRWWEV